MAALEMQLQRFDHIPDELLALNVTRLQEFLGGPSLFRVAGQRKPPLFVTVLQHGNEPTGFEAVQAILRKYAGQSLPREMWLFISNVAAAEQGLRVLPGQVDYNRCWPGTDMPDCLETDLMADVVTEVTSEPLFASIDLHNNTGCNPYYGCVNILDDRYLHLATLFSRTVVFFERPLGVQSIAMAQHTPAVTLECGQAGESAALAHAIDYLDACLHMHHLPEQSLAPHDVHLLHTVATVKVREGVEFGFNDTAIPVSFRPDLDHFNFGRLKKGDWLAEVTEEGTLPIHVFNEVGEDIAPFYFGFDQGKLIAKRDIIPSMATLDTDVIRQDCLFYVMEEMATRRD